MEDLKEREDSMTERETNHKINLDINVNKEEVEDTLTEIKEATDTRANITIRNNQNVYVTINNFNETEKEYNSLEEEIKE